MERDDFYKSIQLPGSKPGDANWKYARWGWESAEHMLQELFGDDESGAENSSASANLEDGNDELLLNATINAVKTCDSS